MGIIEELKELGLIVPRTFQEWRKNWNPEYFDGNCYRCDRTRIVMEFGGEDVCYTCFLEDWKNKYMFFNLDENKAQELFEKHLKEINNDR